MAVIPTGRMEWNALPEALSRLFPDHEFHSVPSVGEVASNRDIGFPIPSFTSNDVTRFFDRENPADDLVQRAAAEAIGDRRRNRAPADLVVVLDDLELANRHQPDAVIQVAQEAVRRHLARLEFRTQERTRKALRERVSLHLVVPMIESWLFADPRGPANAGCPPDRTPRLRDVEPEDFETHDDDYAAATLHACTCWQSLPAARKAQQRRRNKLRPAWAGNLDRTRHPKGYLQWLCIDSSSKSCTTYDESHGTQALTVLDWQHLLTSVRLPYLRSLVADIADALGQEPVVGPIEGHQAPLTCRKHAPTEVLLRNL
ncbi:hypothetical protein [Paraliomyxa miuraensis]|uniref:hypothetical protein n=1 Tax=Paraliomyxa miuraensis TaxID=376150 RepID=UPI0022551290|nr:hypothetical protein [Paraliomyxa miuraensis]MCX4242924.1 hypothetical protein [Paraliomyxa miuraensis]